MGLVIIAAGERQLRPRQVYGLVKGLKGALKAADPAPRLGGDSDMFPKDLREPPLAHAHGLRAIRNTKTLFAEKMHRLVDQRRAPHAIAKESCQ